MDYKTWIPRFDLRNSELAFLAATTAVDIDNYMLGRSQERESARYLSQLLNETTQGESPRASLPDIGTVLSLAVSGRKDYGEYWKGKNLGEVVLETNLASKDLRDLKDLPRARQEVLRDFCVRLSKEVMHHHHQYYSKRRLVA